VDATGRDIADPAFLPYAFNKNKQLMGTTQQAWLDTQMTASKATCRCSAIRPLWGACRYRIGIVDQLEARPR